MIYEMAKSRADFAVRTDEKGKRVLETSKSTILIPKTQWNGVGIKWLDEKRRES